MVYRLGVEDIEPNHWVAFVFDHPGCFSSAATQEEAIANAPARIVEYFEWLANYDCTAPTRNAAIEVKVEEVFHAYPSADDPSYIVNALFEGDCKPLTRPEIDTGLAIYGYAAHDIKALIEKIPATHLNRSLASDDKNSIAKILDHVAWAEYWYFARLNLAFPRNEMSGDALMKLDLVRKQTQAQMPNLVGYALIVDKIGEKWSARKVLRRTLWHIRDHTHQVKKLIAT